MPSCFIFIGMGNLNCTSEKSSQEKYGVSTLPEKSSRRRSIKYDKVSIRDMKGMMNNITSDMPAYIL